GILYLVLLGLVALNVSDSVLLAFKNLSDSLSTSTRNTQAGIDNMFTAFKETKLKDEEERARPILQRAEEASRLANYLSLYVDSVKTLLIEEGGGINEKTGDVNKRDNLSISTRIMLQQEHGKRLKDLINQTKSSLMEISNNEINFNLDAEDPAPSGGVSKTWEQVNFGDGIPLTAAITVLEKIKADAKNAESAVVK